MAHAFLFPGAEAYVACDMRAEGWRCRALDIARCFQVMRKIYTCRKGAPERRVLDKIHDVLMFVWVCEVISGGSFVVTNAVL